MNEEKNVLTRAQEKDNRKFIEKKLLTGGWNHVRLDLPRLSVDELDAINELLAHGRRVILSPGEDFVDVICKGILSQRIT